MDNQNGDKADQYGGKYHQHGDKVDKDDDKGHEYGDPDHKNGDNVPYKILQKAAEGWGKLR